MSYKVRALFLFLFAICFILFAGCLTTGPDGTKPWLDPTSTIDEAVEPEEPPLSQVVLPVVVSEANTVLEEAPTFTPTPTVLPTVEQSIRLAVIGDYGGGGQPEADVANLINSWNPDLIITTGDNNYPDGSAETIDANIGQFFHEFIFPYSGDYGEGADQNRFFPTMGNHDWNTARAQPYLDYFTLPGNERYYDLIWGPVHLFALDSDSREPDGVGSSSLQAEWLQGKLGGSSAPWKIVFMHHPPYSSGLHGSVDWARWPYKDWGASVVISGHDHTYERIILDGFPYFVNGLGGGSIYYFENIVEGSEVRYNSDYGAMLVEANRDWLSFQFINRGGEIIDEYAIEKSR